MTIRSLDTDPAKLALTVVADFPVPVHRLWDAYVDPRQLEAFWGPPTWPATFTRHGFRPGGRSEYVMTGPEGEQAFGYWQFNRVDPPHGFEVVDGFAHADGTPNDALPTVRTVYAFEESTLGSLVTATSHFSSAQDMDQLLAMQMVEGLREAMGRMDAVVTDESTYSASHIAQLQYLTDTVIRVSRVIRAPIDKVWAAHHNPELVRDWMLGPDGWVMTTCDVAQQVGDSYRYEWKLPGAPTGSVLPGELLAFDAPYHFVRPKGCWASTVPARPMRSISPRSARAPCSPPSWSTRRVNCAMWLSTRAWSPGWRTVTPGWSLRSWRANEVVATRRWRGASFR